MNPSSSLSRTSRALLRHNKILRPLSLRAANAHNSVVPYFALTPSATSSTASSYRHFTSSHTFKGILPESSNPPAPKPEAHSSSTTNAHPAPLTDDEYHEIADESISKLLAVLEERAEDATNGIEVEYSAGVLNLTTPKGSYVLNKQPPNKQIWLSSPVSGPKRYDYVISGAGQHEKEGSDMQGSGGKWVYLRDGSTLDELLEKEVDLGTGVGDVLSGKDAQGGRAKLEGE